MTNQRRDDQRPIEVTHEEQADDSAAGPDFLKEVMSQTVANIASTRELSPQVFAALLEVARRYPGEPLSLDPIAIELVAACLAVQMPMIASREALSRRMNAWIASSLLEDPAAQQRLSELWARLGEAA
ncbi:hypothetical protein [Anatilimnocola floriformis]|uniref:hypothetical protein n=1 Tax=Anatilimnocola floriformis TaxID=2948575 RepID=UPI0020C1EE94|nr:hypothetical protein [Anatilimnocola floriformis]